MTKFFGFFFASAMLLMQSGMADIKGQEDKLYVNLGDLVLDSSGMWFNEVNNSLQRGATALYFDGGGYYVAYSEQTWRCPRCKITNPQGVSNCSRCNWPD